MNNTKSPVKLSLNPNTIIRRFPRSANHAYFWAEDGSLYEASTDKLGNTSHKHVAEVPIGNCSRLSEKQINDLELKYYQQ